MKYSGHNLYPARGKTQDECAALCFHEPACHFWTHNAASSKCWLKKSDLGKSPSSVGSNSGQKACGLKGGKTLQEISYSYPQRRIFFLATSSEQAAPVSQVQLIT